MAKQGLPEAVETERLVLRWYRNEDGPGILELMNTDRAQLIREFEQLALGEKARSTDRANPGEEHCMGNSLGRIGLFHRQSVAKTRLRGREHSTNRGPCISNPRVSEDLRANSAVESAELCLSQEIRISGGGTAPEGFALRSGRIT